MSLLVFFFLVFFFNSKVGMEESRSSSILGRRAPAVEFLFMLFSYLKGFQELDLGFFVELFVWFSPLS